MKGRKKASKNTFIQLIIINFRVHLTFQCKRNEERRCFSCREREKKQCLISQKIPFFLFSLFLSLLVSLPVSLSPVFFFATSFIPPFLHVTHLSKTVTLLCYNGCIKTAFWCIYSINNLMGIIRRKFNQIICTPASLYGV